MSDSGESSLSISRPTTPVASTPATAKPFRFTWDPSSRRPGPESVSGTTTDGRNEYFATKLGDYAFNASTTNLGLGTLPSEWSSAKHGFHAISTVLNNPHKAQAPPKAHSSLPAVPPADLPRVRRKDFDPYLKALGPEWEKYEQNIQQLAESAQPEPEPPTPRQSISSIDTPAPPSKPMPSLDVVPAIFFDSKFNFGDPRTFAAVTEQDTNLDPDYDPTSLAHSLPLLERFSHYADTIEMHLTHEISLRSSSFFAALSNLHMLHAESSACLDQVTKLRKLLVEVDEDVAKRGLELVRKQHKLAHVQMVDDGIRGISDMVEMTEVARGLVGSGQWGEALGLAEELEGHWNSGVPQKEKRPPREEPPNRRPQPNGSLSPIPGTPDPGTPHTPKNHRPIRLPVPLSALHAFASLPDHLRALTVEIASTLSSELVAQLRVDLVARVGGKGDPSDSKANELMKERLSPVLEGLVRTKGMKEATLSWREVVVSEVRSIVGGYFSSFDFGDVDAKAQAKTNGRTSLSDERPGLAQHLRNLSHSDYMKVLRDVYQSLLNAIEGLQAQNMIMGELMASISSTQSHRDESLQTDLTDILTSAAELSHAQAAKIISVRADQHAALELVDFAQFFKESWSFVVKGEVVCRTMIVGLRSVIVGQSKVFLQTFHQARLSQSAKLVEDEQWASQEVLPPLQHIADILVDAAVRNPPELVLHEKDAKPSSGELTPTGPPPKGAKHLRIDDRTYFTVPATSDVLSLIMDYLKVIVNLDMLTTDTMGRIIEFLKAFNSRTCQVVLGAGAMRSAGLKNITAKHLALASQSLSIMIALIPYIRETFRRHLSSKQAVILVEFDKLKRDYQEHQNEIYAKLIAIMGDRLSFHINSLNAINWSEPKDGVNSYMEVLIKETVTLHKVLTRYLTAPVVEDIMTQVLAAINHRLSEEFSKLVLPDMGAKDRLLADAKYLHAKLSALKNVGTPSGMLEMVIRENTLPRTPLPRTPTRGSSLLSPIPSPAPRSPSPQTPASASIVSSASTSERLRGLLANSGRKSSFDTSSLPTPPRDGRGSPGYIRPDSASGSREPNGHASPAPTPPAKVESLDPLRSSTGNSGFRQVQISVLDPPETARTLSANNTPTEARAPESPSPPPAATESVVGDSQTNTDTSDSIVAETPVSPGTVVDSEKTS